MRRTIITEDDLKRFILKRDRDPIMQKSKVRGGVERHAPTLSVAGKDGERVIRGSGKANPSPRCVAGSNPAPSPLMLAIIGQLPSGKNQVQLFFRNGKVHKYPNKRFSIWRATATGQIVVQVSRYGTRIPTITTPVCLTVEYWPGDRCTRDVSGQLDALFHLLVYSSVLKDDGLVHDVIWKRHAMNRKFPKVLLTIEEAR